MVVRADGNNFIPELAAAATAIKACPVGLPMTLKMDSTAAIGAISKGIVSERKRVRAAGRAWLNFSRQDFVNKRQSIKIQHVSSHKGTASIEQKGNDLADTVAKEYLRLGQSQPAAHYFTEAEEAFVLKHKENVIQSDIRLYLKSLESDMMMAEWKKKAPKQAKWASRYPTQVMKQAKRVWKWSIEKGDGAAWLYFIFAICQWLPTNHRYIIMRIRVDG